MTTSTKNKRFKPAPDLNQNVYGKLQPQARELEEAILGAILLDATAFDKVYDILKPGCFYTDAHQRIFKCMVDLNSRHNPIDLLTVTQELMKNEELEMVGGPHYVTQLTNRVVNTTNVEHHCRLVLQKFIQREQIRIGNLSVQLGYDETMDPFDSRDEIEQELTKLYTGHIRSNYLRIDSSIVKLIQHIEAKRSQGRDITGVTTGFSDINSATHGWQATDLIILAARPAVGKTALALNLSVNAAKDKVPVGFFSMEMSHIQLSARMISAETKIHLERVLHGYLDDAAMKQLYETGVQKIAQLPIYIDDSHSLNIYELRTRARKMKREHDIGLLVVDYLQLMQGMEEKNNNRNNELSKITRDLKGLAKELKIPIIALSQLSRDVEKRKGEKMPIMSDLRDSGAIEQDADLVMMMYRPEYYDINTNDMGESTNGETHLRITKHRNGKPGLLKLRVELEYQKFYNYDALHAPGPQLPGNWKPFAEVKDENELT